MLAYILKVSCCWAGFLLLYMLMLRRETYFNLNRAYLLFSLIGGMCIPLIDWQWPGSEPAEPILSALYLQPVIIGIGSVEALVQTAPLVDQQWNYKNWLLIIYWCGAGIIFLRSLLGIGLIVRLIRLGQIEKDAGQNLVFHRFDLLPFSFFNYLFFNEGLRKNEAALKQIKLHERAHSRGWHSLDVSLLEVLCAFFWCSPLIYLFKRALKLQHEFIADAKAIKVLDRKQYGQLLIRQSMSGHPVAIANHFSLQLKKRFTMMKRRRSKPLAYLKYGLAMPVLAVLQMAFGQPSDALLRSHAEAESSSQKRTIASVKALEEVDELPIFGACGDELAGEELKKCSDHNLLTHVFTNIKYPSAARDANIQGMVVVKFILDQEGTVRTPLVIKAIGGGCDEEVLRVIKEMSAWTPARKDGKPVEFEYTLPVRFKLSDDEEVEQPLKEVDEMPRFPGCEDRDLTKEALQKCANKNLMSFIANNVQYPKVAKEKGLEGMALLNFVVEKDGRVTSLKIKSDVEGAFGKEVLRVGGMLPDFTPGQKGGKAVRTELNLPIRFALPKKHEAGRPQGLPDQLELKAFKVSANPTADLFNLSFEAVAGVLQVNVANLAGKSVYSFQTDAFEGSFNTGIDLSDQPAGPYFLTIRQNNKAFTYKIVKQ